MPAERNGGEHAETCPPCKGRLSARRSVVVWVLMMLGLGAMFLLDGPVLALVRPLHASRFSEIVDKTIRQLGTGQVQAGALLLLLLCGIALKNRRARAAAGWGILALVVSAVLAQVLKVLIHRHRPWAMVPDLPSWAAYVSLAIRESSLRAFPSGESSTTFAVAWTVAAFHPRLRWPLLGIASVVAAARVLVGAHHPSDVWAGAMLGIAVGQWVLRAANRRQGTDCGTTNQRAMIGAPVNRCAGRSSLPFVLLLAFTAVLFLGGLGRLPLLGRDESLYAEAAREMLASGDWVTPHVNGGPFFEKPPLYYWMAAASYRLVGVSPFAARLPAALLALLTVALTMGIGAKVWGRRSGLLAGLALATSLQMAIIGRMGIMDVPLTCLTLLALLAYARWHTRGDMLGAVGFGLFVALGLLLKGMAGLIPLGVALLHQLMQIAAGRLHRVTWASVPRAALSTVVLVAVAAPWFLIMAHRHGEQFGSTLIWHEHLRRILHPMQGHGGPFWFYLPLIILGFFPWVVFLPEGMRRGEDESNAERFWRGLCIVWIAVVLIGFSAIRTKLPGYVLPLFPPMALLVGAELDRRLSKPGRSPWAAAAALGLLLGVGVALLPKLAARLAPGAGAGNAVPLLTPGVVVWAASYLLIVLGALIVLAGSPSGGVGMITAGQMAVLGAALIGILPVVSPYLEGGREYLLAQEARLVERAVRDQPWERTLLYETRPEAVAFVLEHLVPVFDENQQTELLAELRKGRRLLIAPAEAKALWTSFTLKEIAHAGDRVLLDIRPQTEKQEAKP